MAFLLRAIGFTESIPGFPYTPCSGSSTTTADTPTITWTMRQGECDESKRSVTIFSVNLADMEPRKRELVRHAMKRAKSLLLPGILRCYGAAEHRDTVYLATEPCEPLSKMKCGQMGSPLATSGDDDDEGEAFNDIVALGLKAVGSAVSALHKNKLIHGNVGRDSVFVISTGEWRLFGLELVSGFDDVGSSYLSYCSLLPAYRRPPETQHTNYESGGKTCAIDSWGLACLIYEVLGVNDQTSGKLSQSCSTEDLRSCRTLPRTLQSGFSGLCAVNPKMRHDVDRFLRTSDFIISSDYVQSMQMLDDYSLKDAAERERFMEHLANVVHTFPRDACKHLVLQKLRASFTFGILPGVVDTVVKIAARMPSPEEYATHVSPVIVALFRSKERMVRLRILQHAAELLPQMPPAVVDGEVWSEYASGFESPIAAIREHSARALVPIAPLLTEKRIVNDVPKYIAQLQQDSEGPIRTNATIALCLIADTIPAEYRSKLFAQRFGRMLKDPFAPSRTAALRSFHTTLKHFTAQDIAELVIPGVSPLSMDKVAEVRAVALDVIHAAVSRLDANHREISSSTANEGNVIPPAGVVNNNTNGAGNEVKGSNAALDTKGWGSSGSSSVIQLESTTKGGMENSIPAASKASPFPQKVWGSQSSPSVREDDEESWGEEIQMKPQKLRLHGTATRNGTGAVVPDSLTSDDHPEDKRTLKIRKKGIGASRLS
ncbi:uncharacterized protein TEOVI_000130100 [Trypanosoma equiperdum]|uniref:Protein kinase domain-containing protein n=2 Tax=Trypanozoon TaxID=39700 RepID=Q38CA8_TRYB2|nr:hypothetical protein, conserved [Trypanosoma brucei brucei TREU927]EAN77562.1 hypothetical protein, conserved [Trypanosoma brucei brucei TREU927]SCU69732.1 hypothetical protein, conserved [Trypanosoma equiperdum]